MQAIMGSNEVKMSEVSLSDYAALVIGECDGHVSGGELARLALDVIVHFVIRGLNG